MLFINNMQLAYVNNKQYSAEMSASKQLRQHLFEQGIQYTFYPLFYRTLLNQNSWLTKVCLSLPGLYSIQTLVSFAEHSPCKTGI